MRPFLTTGENVVQLIYPLKYCGPKEQNIVSLLETKHWTRILQPPFSNKTTCTEDYFFAQDYKDQHGKNTLIADQDIISYFHPSVQNTLFHQQKSLKIFGEPTPRTSRMFEGKFVNGQTKEQSTETLLFEWLASEIYTFSANSAFLVIRLSLHKKNKDGNQLPLDSWMKFVNRIRQNYIKYAKQHTIVVKPYETTNAYESFFQTVYAFIKQIDAQLHLSTLSANHSLLTKQHDSQQIRLLNEPNAFTHAFMSTNFTGYNKLTNNELYQCIHLDDYDGESGGTEAFKEQFLQSNVYRRWENYHTYYTAIDYGAISLINHDSTHSPLFQQHHCRHYLLFIILQLYYREELQELAGRYARLSTVEDKEAHHILDDYYNMNQHFIFNRVSNEIQGREMWKFYYKAFEIDELYRAVNDDMKELNERNKEAHAFKQENQVRNLTVIAAFTGLLGMNLVIPNFDKSIPSLKGIYTIPPNFKDYIGISANLLVTVVIIFVLFHISRLVPRVSVIIISLISITLIVIQKFQILGFILIITVLPFLFNYLWNSKNDNPKS